MRIPRSASIVIIVVGLPLAAAFWWDILRGDDVAPESSPTAAAPTPSAPAPPAPAPPAAPAAPTTDDPCDGVRDKVAYYDNLMRTQPPSDFTSWVKAEHAKQQKLLRSCENR